jgi:NAD(P)-dependent dehydrogenase (short-subunit alcohol dehydrogenase family)
MVARVVQEWGRVDVLVANAGGGHDRPWIQRPVPSIRRSYGVLPR